MSSSSLSSSSSSLSGPQLVEHTSSSVAFTLYTTRWVPSAARLLLGGMFPRGSGALQIHKLDKGKLVVVAETERKHGVKCATFGASLFEERRVAVGDFGGFLTVFDLERLDKPVLELEAHKGLINAIDGCGGLNVGLGACEIATAGKDGTVKIFDVRQREPVAVMQPEQEGSGRDCWAVAFGNAFSVDERVVVAGYDNGDLKLLDLKMNKIRWETNVGNGICSLEFDRKDIQMNKLAVGGLEANFRVFDMRTQHTEQGFASVSQKAHKSTVWTTRFLPQNREILASTGGNGTINLYKYSYPEQRVIKDDKGREMGVAGTLEQLATTRVSEHPIVSFDWHMDKMGLYAAGCIDQTVRVGLATKLQTI